MTTTSSHQTMLADLYRRARTLASEDTAQPGPTAELSEATAALFGEKAAAVGGEPLAANEKRLEAMRERIRRIAIVALRRQALAARQAWADNGGSEVAKDASATALLAQALTFGEAALRLHREGDPARDSTQRIVAFLLSTLTIANAPPKQGRAPQAAREALVEAQAQAVVFVAGDPPPTDEGPSPAQEDREHGRSVPVRRSALVPALAAIAVAGFLMGFVVAPRVWRRGASSPAEVRITRPAVLPSPAQAARNGSPAPAGAAGSTTAARPATAAPAGGTTAAQTPVAAGTQHAVITPATPGNVAVVLRSEPSGAQVFIAGVWKGTTPLRLEPPAGAMLRLTVRRGTRVWRGTLRVGDRSGQVLTVRLPDSGPVTARSTPPPPSPTPAATTDPAASARVHFEGLMVQGVELYRGGWYGPAMARFRAASAVRPDAPSPYLWYARAALKVGRTADARRALERVIAIAPASAAAREAQALLNRLR